jgi:hypothetical protein
MSDFSLMDAIECGIVKLPRVPVADNIPGEEMPMFRNLWDHIRSKMPRKGRGKSATLDPLSLPPRETIHVKAVRPERDPLEIRFPRVVGYRVELPEERLTAEFNEDSVLELTPDLVGATETQNSGIIGKRVDLNLVHTGDVRPSQVLYELVSHLVLTKWRDPGEDPKLHLFGQLKRIARQWLEGYLVCKGGTYPAQLKYKMPADMACERITAGITRKFVGRRPIMAVLDPYNPTGSTAHVSFNTSKTDRWETDPRRCHINWVILDSDGKQSSAAWPSPTRASAPMSRIIASVLRCPTATARRCANISPTSSCWRMTSLRRDFGRQAVTATTTFCA